MCVRVLVCKGVTIIIRLLLLDVTYFLAQIRPPDSRPPIQFQQRNALSLSLARSAPSPCAPSSWRRAAPAAWAPSVPSTHLPGEHRGRLAVSSFCWWARSRFQQWHNNHHRHTIYMVSFTFRNTREKDSLYVHICSEHRIECDSYYT